MIDPQQYKILVVDDDADDREVLQDAFVQLGCTEQVTFYPSGTALLNDADRLRRRSPLPRVIVLDYQMPCSTGLEVLKTLKEDPVLCSVPVVLYTTSLSRTVEKDCLNNGALRCFTKGVSVHEVMVFATFVLETARETHTAA